MAAPLLACHLSVPGWIRRYARKLSEGSGFVSPSPPDPMVSAWSRLKRSFSDFETEVLYPEQSNLVFSNSCAACFLRHGTRALSFFVLRSTGVADPSSIHTKVIRALNQKTAHGPRTRPRNWAVIASILPLRRKPRASLSNPAFRVPCPLNGREHTSPSFSIRFPS